MTYLHPPPGDAPVIVMKDVGGYVSEYAAQTAQYLYGNREVRLHECRSACTLALSLPNVCVYPTSVLKFHKAYDPVTRIANEEVSDRMMAAYPAPVRARLGFLTRDYKVLTGSELIRLGVRQCETPRQPQILLARARAREAGPGNPVSDAFSSVVAALSPAATAATAAQVQIRRVTVASLAPKPPARPPEFSEKPRPAAPPADLSSAEPPKAAAAVTPPTAAPAPSLPSSPHEARETGTAEVKVAEAGPATAAAPPSVRTPIPVAPTLLTLTRDWSRPIRGGAPILGVRFSPYSYNFAGRS